MRTLSRSAAATAAAVLLAVLGAGCASVAAGSSQSGPGQAVDSAPADLRGGGGAGAAQIGGNCPTTSADPAVGKLRTGITAVALPRDFRPVAAVRCLSSIRIVPGDGEWEFADAQRADSGLADLVTSLRLPSVTASEDTPCTAIGMVVHPFALVDASGAVINPLLPHGVCGLPLPQVTKAMNALPWRTETEQRVRQTRTQAEIDTACPPEYKYVFELPVYGPPEPWSKVRRPENPQPTTACFYGVGSRTADNPVAVGSFTRGVKLSTAQQGTVLGALDQATDTPALACTATATRFALLDGPGAGMLVELDGCRRVYWPNAFMDAAPTALLQTLASLGAH